MFYSLLIAPSCLMQKDIECFYVCVCICLCFCSKISHKAVNDVHQCTSIIQCIEYVNQPAIQHDTIGICFYAIICRREDFCRIKKKAYHPTCLTCEICRVFFFKLKCSWSSNFITLSNLQSYHRRISEKWIVHFFPIYSQNDGYESSTGQNEIGNMAPK